MRRARGVVALEEEAAAIAAPEVAEIGDNAESVETEMLEIADDVAEGEAEAVQVEEAGEVVEALESIAEALKVSAANGGLDKHAAFAIGVATQHLYSRVGLKSKSMPSMESFGGTSSRVGATQLAMEDIKEQAKKIWDAIVAAFKRAIQWAVDFYNKIFGAWEKLEKRADALAKKAEDITGTAKEKTFESDRLVKALSVGGTVPANMSEGTKALAALCKGLSTSNGTKDAAEIAAMLEAAGAEKDFLTKFELAPNADSVPDSSEVTNPESAGFSAPKPGLTLVRSKEMFGNKALIGRVNKATLKGEEAVAALGGAIGRGVSMGAFDPKAKESTKKDVAVMAIAEAKAVAEAVAEIAVEGRAYRNKLSAVTDMKKKLVAAAEKIGKTADSTETAANVKAMGKVASALVSTIDQPAASVSVYALNTGKALLDYVEQSLKQYVKADK